MSKVTGSDVSCLFGRDRLLVIGHPLRCHSIVIQWSFGGHSVFIQWSFSGHSVVIGQ